MKPLRASRRISFPIEPLEARIAPALVFIGDARETMPPAVDTLLDTEYREGNVTPTQSILFTDTSASTDPISVAVDSAATNNTFFLRLSAGDEVRAFTNAGSYQELITVSKGNVIAFFVDYNNNNNYDSGEFTGMALGANTIVNVAGNVRGDIVTNLDERGTAATGDDTVSLTSLVSPNQGIDRLGVTGGSIFADVLADGTVQYAKVLSGGSIRALTINGTLGSALAGGATNGATFDFFPDRTAADGTIQLQPGGNGTVTFTLAPRQSGASIVDSRLDAVVDRVEAGAGGAGASGGDIDNIQITADTDALSIIAGAGGPADAAGKNKGGTGGSVTRVIVAGVIDPTPNGESNLATAPLRIIGGDGGDATATGKGGVGGRVENIFVGFEVNRGQVVNSGDLLRDPITILSGQGGDGKSGGRGGSIADLRIRIQTADAVQTPTDAVEDEVIIAAGNGGNNLIGGGKAGPGGSLDNVTVRNQEMGFGATASSMLLMAGDGGTTTGASKGAKGGGISGSTLLGYEARVLAGDGSGGRVGGRGGDVTDLEFVRDDAILTHAALIDAGKGGDATERKAGKGGNVLNVRSLATDVFSFVINSGVQGDGGTSIAGKGGKGGKVQGISLFDTDTGNLIAGTISVRAGTGGDGGSAGGAGGILAGANITSLNAHIIAGAGDGGDATLSGKGGKGGRMTLAQFTADGTVPDPMDPTIEVDVFGRATSGNGGAARGSGAGGAGGLVKLVNMNVDGAASLIAGAGGNGQDGIGGTKAGKGGSIDTSGIFARDGAGVLQAGDAGLLGGRPAKGGSIIGKAAGVVVPGATLSGLRAATNLLIEAGDGSGGGAGGNIRNIAYGSTADSLTPTPSGNIMVTAGNGSALGGFAGRGGSIAKVFGSVSSVDPGNPGGTAVTSFRAGDGGGAQRSGAGGSITDVLLTLGGGPGVLLTIQAGDAGDTSGVRGAPGGSVRDIGVTDLNGATNFRSIAAGDGGDAGAIGGRGGSLTRLFVQNEDIGERTGQPFGFLTMGGLFAGRGGDAARDGLNGSVSGATANAIASIVAGRAQPGGEVPQMVTRVDHIFLNDDNLLLERNGAFLPDGSFNPAYYAIANLVGAIVDITGPDARTFDFTELNGTPGFQVGDMPVDGILMARFIDQRTINFIPEARLTTDRVTGAQEFFDNDNRL